MDIKLARNQNKLREAEKLGNGCRMVTKDMKLSKDADNDQCHCCPYGFHIDLDFVRYCESLSSGTYLQQLKQLRKDRRKQRKSIEALLSYHEEHQRQLDEFDKNHVFPSDNIQAPPPDLVNTNDALRDALREAMLDFEETLQKSRTSGPDSGKSSKSYIPSDSLASIDLLSNAHNLSVSSDSSSDHLSPHASVTKTASTKPGHPSSGTHTEGFSSLMASRSRSGSASSLTSVSTVSSFAEHFLSPPPPQLASQQMVDTMSTLANSFVTRNSVTSPNSGGKTSPNMVTMNTSTLQSIREQMAASLQRMRELEDHVKTIPILQVKLSVLKEEKRLLMLQLKAKAAKLDHRSVGVGDSSVDDMSSEEIGKRLDRLSVTGITTPRVRRRSLPGSPRSRSESPGFRSRPTVIDLSDFHSHKRFTCLSSETQNGSMDDLHQVFTRNIHVVPDLYLKETRSVGINCSVLTRDVGISHVVPNTRSVGVGSIAVQDVLCVDCECRRRRESRKNLEPPEPCPQCKKRAETLFNNVAVNTDIRKVSIKEVQTVKNEVKPIEIPSCKDCEVRNNKQFSNIGVSINLLESERKKSVIENATNTPLVLSKNQACNTNAKSIHNKFVNTKMLMEDIISKEEYDTVVAFANSLQNKPAMKDSTTQTKDYTVTHNISVQTVLENQMKPVKPSQRDVGILVDLTEKVKLIEKGIGDESVTKVICDRCQNVRTKTVGVGYFSIKDILCDRCAHYQSRNVGVGDSKITDILCDKCSSLKQRTVGCGSSSIQDIVCDRCANLRTTSVGVGNADINVSICSNCANRKVRDMCIGSDQQKLRSVETNTIDMMTSSTDSERSLSGSSYYGLRICDKCSATIHSVATDLVQKTEPLELLAPPSLPSRIPRPTVSTTEATRIITTITNSAVTSTRTTTETSVKPHHKQLGRRELMARPTASPIKQTKEGYFNKNCQLDNRRIMGTNEEMSSSESSDSSDSSDSETSDSPDEGSYDGIHGRIVNSCQDDEAIRRGLPGATMFQPIQDTPYVKQQISTEMLEACKALHENIMKSNHVSSKQLNSSLNIIQQEWFKISSQRNADPHLVEDYLDAFEDISRQVLHRVVNLADANGNTAMHYAVSHGNFDVVSLLLDSKVCDVNKQNKAGYTCIMLASLAMIRNDIDRQVLQRLFQLGDINVKASQHGQTALMLAVSHGRLDVVKMLLEAGADINIQDEDGSTALMCASEHGHLDIVKFLLQHTDCDPTITDNDNSTALTIAMEAGHKDIGVLIYAHMNFSRGSSPYASMRVKGKKIPPSLASTTPPRTPPPPSPALSRKSTKSVP